MSNAALVLWHVGGVIGECATTRMTNRPAFNAESVTQDSVLKRKKSSI